VIGLTLAGRFTIVGLVGVGSMGKVYRAVQRGTERSVALKVLRPERARDAKAKARFLREARACSSLASPHTVRVFDFGESDEGELFLAVELLEGESLAKRLKRDTRLSVLAAIEATLAALKSLEEAHAKGLIHRDLKPANLFYARVATGGGGFDEILKVLDFGGAKFIAPEGKPLNAMDTLEGFVVGTPRYMSPEQAEGKPLDGRSDIYSLAAVLYHMLTGRAPFIDDDPELVLAKQIRTTPDLPSVVCPEAAIPAELEALLLRAMSKNRDERPRDATCFSQELAAFVDGPPSTRMSTGVLRASIPPPASGHMSAASGGSSTSSGPFGSGRSIRTSVPSVPSISGPSVSAPTAFAPMTPPGTFPAASLPAGQSGSGPAVSARSPDQAPELGSQTKDVAAPAPPRLDTTRAAPPPPARRRVGGWFGGVVVGLVILAAWFSSGQGTMLTSSPASAPPPAAIALPPAAAARPAATASPFASPDAQVIVSVESLPHARTDAPVRPWTRHPPPLAPPAPSVSMKAPPPPETAPAPAPAPPPSATATSSYHYFE